MVTVSSYAVRKQGTEDAFVVLVLTGDLQMVQSQKSGRYYATVKKCSISSTFTEGLAEQMVGKKLPGSILKQECDAYEYTIPETGEIIQLAHRWVYSPEEATEAPRVEAPKVEPPLTTFSNNGVAAMA